MARGQDPFAEHVGGGQHHPFGVGGGGVEVQAGPQRGELGLPAVGPAPLAQVRQPLVAQASQIPVVIAGLDDPARDPGVQIGGAPARAAEIHQEWRILGMGLEPGQAGGTEPARMTIKGGQGHGADMAAREAGQAGVVTDHVALDDPFGGDQDAAAGGHRGQGGLGQRRSQQAVSLGVGCGHVQQGQVRSQGSDQPQRFTVAEGIVDGVEGVGVVLGHRRTGQGAGGYRRNAERACGQALEQGQ